MPYTDTITLVNGVIARLEMPDLYAVLAYVGTVPSPETARVLQLLEGTGALERQNFAQRLEGQRNYWKGMYEIAALCMVEPRLVLRTTDENDQPIELHDGDLTPRDLSLNEVQGIYYRFFLGKQAKLAGDAPDPDRLEALTSLVNDLLQATK